MSTIDQMSISPVSCRAPDLAEEIAKIKAALAGPPDGPWEINRLDSCGIWIRDRPGAGKRPPASSDDNDGPAATHFVRLQPQTVAALLKDIETGQMAMEFVRKYARERKAGPLAAVMREARALASQWAIEG